MYKYICMYTFLFLYMYIYFEVYMYVNTCIYLVRVRRIGSQLVTERNVRTYCYKARYGDVISVALTTSHSGDKEDEEHRI